MSTKSAWSLAGYGGAKAAAARAPKPAGAWSLAGWGGPQGAANRAAGVASPPPAASPAAPDTMAQPFDPAYQAQVLGSQYQVGLANNEASYQQGQTAYNTGYDQTGALNTANPYSQAQLLQDSYHRGQAGTTNSMAAQGQLYSGALQNARATDDRNYAQQSDAQRRAAMDQYHQIGAGQLQTYAGNAAGLGSGAFNSLSKSVYGG